MEPIGFFDSGLGGLSIWNAVTKLLPSESTIYYADNKYCPYGGRAQSFIIERSRVITEELIRLNAKLIVVACNSATAFAIDFLREHYPIPFVGIEPAIKPASLATRTGVVGVLATDATFHGRPFLDTIEKIPKGVKIILGHVNGWVEVVEKGDILAPETMSLVESQIRPIIARGVDCLVLGCTHFPFLRKAIQKVAPDIQLFDPSFAVAKQVEHLLKQNNLLSVGMASHTRIFSGSEASLRTITTLLSALD